MQRIHPAAHLMLCAWVFTGVVTSADESEHRVDELKLKQFQRSVNIIEIRRAELDEAMDTQFDKLVTDTLGGGIQDDEVYVEPVANLAKRILEEFDGQLNDSMVTRLRNTLARQDSEFARRANAVIVERDRIAADLIEPIRASYTEPKDDKTPAKLTLKVFQTRADALVGELIANGELLKQINMDRDHMEDFLAETSRRIWANVDKGKRRAYLPGSHKATLQKIMRDYLKKHKFFDAEEPLRRACDKFGKRDKDSSLHLLYSFVLLINKSNPVSVEQGYVELEKAFDKLHTERLAYNIVRVGARLNRLDVPRLMKLIDHASFRDDSAGLDNLYNLAMHQFVKHNHLDQAVALYDRLLKEKRTQSLAPIFSFLVLMHTGEYERIQGEVQADSLEALTAAD